MLRGSATTRSARLQFMVLEGKAAARRGVRAQAQEEGRGEEGSLVGLPPCPAPPPHSLPCPKNGVIGSKP